MNTKSAYNCGHCDKCLRTMMGLYVAGVLEKTKTFPHKLDYDLVAEGPHINGDGVYIAHGERDALRRLKKQGRDPKMQEAIETKLYKIDHMHAGFKGRLILAKDRFYLKIVYLDFAYTRSMLYRALAAGFGKKFIND